jgi:hypothetical protein
VEDSVRPGVYATGARNFEGWIEWYGQARLRLGPGLPLLPQRYWSLGFVMTPVAWMPLLELSADIGRLADTAVGPAGVLRRGGKLAAHGPAAPAGGAGAGAAAQPRLARAADGERRYRESAAQLLAIWHFDARHSLRLIAQRRALARRRIRRGGGRRGRRHRFAHLRLAPQRRHAAVRGRHARAPARRARRHELFVKLELDAGELWR